MGRRHMEVVVERTFAVGVRTLVVVGEVGEHT